MSAQFRVALLRGVLIAVLSSATTALAAWSTTDDPKTIAIAAGTAFLAPLAARFGAEGTYDTHKAANV